MTARFSGKYGKGAMRAHSEIKRTQAQERSADVPCERTRAHRLSRRHVTAAQKRAGIKACNCPAAPVESVATGYRSWEPEEQAEWDAMYDR